jgi:hypothetical protein
MQANLKHAARNCETITIGGGEFGPEELKRAADMLDANADLVNALKSFLRAPSVGSNGPGSTTIVVQDFNLKAARAAIAKAEGGAA